MAGPLILLILLEDSSSTLWIRPLFCLLWFYPLFQGRLVYPAYRIFVSIVLVWIRPLLPIKLGFIAAYSVILCEDSSSTLWIRPLFCLLWFYPDSSTLLTGDSSPLFLRLDLFWHKKEAAASTVCLTGSPCHFF